MASRSAVALRLFKGYDFILRYTANGTDKILVSPIEESMIYFRYPKGCKQAGMRWNEPAAQDMVTLKAKEESGIWAASVRNFIMAA
jgi:hypothetical protein